MNSLKKITDTTENGPNRFRLDVSVSELGLLSDLLSSVSDPRADALRQAIECHIRSDVLFDLWIHKSIILCNHCSGTGHIKYWEDFLEEYITTSCQKCKSGGRLVQFTTIRFEPLSSAWKDQLAPVY